jgi:two-component system capsular synthesis sensor histidine kinase RcsC
MSNGSGEDDELYRLRRELAERDDLLALATHELRNQLHTLSLQLKLARIAADASDGANTSERLAKAQDTLARYIARLTLLLELTRVNADAQRLQAHEVDLSALLRQTVDTLQADAQYHGVTLTLSAPPRCPAHTDAAALEHVLSNLMLNAFKHAACRHVTVTLGCDGERARIAVEDDGCGIAASDQQRLFGKFERDGKRSGGTGLGLWICAKLAAALGGRIDLRSATGGGSTFTLEIPLRRGEGPTS